VTDSTAFIKAFRDHYPPQSDHEAVRSGTVNVTQRFGSFVANDKISLKVPAGTFHALGGEMERQKHAGEMRRGVYQADEGDILVQALARNKKPHTHFSSALAW
jgi:ABC-type uncharacterized transport system ATPase subunit